MIEYIYPGSVLLGLSVAWVLSSYPRGPKPPAPPPAPWSVTPTPLEEIGYKHPEGWPVFKVNGIPVAFEPKPGPTRGIEFYVARTREWCQVHTKARAAVLKAALRVQ